MNNISYNKIVKFYMIILILVNVFVWSKVFVGSKNPFKFEYLKTSVLLNKTAQLVSSSESSIVKKDGLSLLMDSFNKVKSGTYLILFQNNYELRPAGGYLGSFGVLTIKDSKYDSLKIIDSVSFDSSSSFSVTPPEPIKKYLNVSKWQLRDSNWSPDFPTSSEAIQNFYKSEGGNNQFDGIIAINTRVLETFLRFTGPIYVKNIHKTFDYQNIVLGLESEVEKDYIARDIPRFLRKEILAPIANEIINKTVSLSLQDDQKFRSEIRRHLDEKDIMLYIKDPAIYQIIKSYFWDGSFDIGQNDDFIGIIDANMDSLKTDLFMTRSIKYALDLTGERPLGNLQISYKSLAIKNTWLAKDYKSYTRVYLPKTSEVLSNNNLIDSLEYEEFNKKVVAGLLEVLSGSTTTINIKYYLPDSIINKNTYKLKVFKQSGITSLGFNLLVNSNFNVLSFSPIEEGYISAPGGILFNTNIVKDTIFKINFNNLNNN